MRKVILDIETKNVFADVGKYDPTLLDLSLVAIYDSETDSYSSYLEEELIKLWPILERADLIIGYNLNHFDIPLLNKYYPGDIAKVRSLDILSEIRKVYGRRMRLDQIAEGTLGKRKSGNGLEASVWWRKGEIDKVRQYCIDDVRITKEIYDFARANNKLIFTEGGKNIEFNIDTSGWEESSDHKLTFTLPF